MIQSHFHHLGIQSHHFPSQEFKVIFSSFRHSEPFLSSILGVQSRIHHLKAFRAVFSSFRLSKSFFFFQFQAFKVMSSVWCSEPCLQYRCSRSFLPVLGIQSHFHQFQAFKVISFSFRLLKSCLQCRRSGQFLPFLGIQIHFHQFQAFRAMSSIQAFKAISSGFRHATFISFRHSDPCLQFGIQSHHLLQFGIQSRVFIYAFKAIVQLGIRCHHLQYRCLGPFLLVLGIQSHFHQFQAFKSMSSV